MAVDGEIQGVAHQGSTPNWAPLEAAVGDEVAGGFMWMFEVTTSDGRRLQAYKHVVTRGYLHLDDDGNAFYFVWDEHDESERYRPIAFDRILEAVLAPWWEIGLDGGPPGAMAAAKRAVRRARATASG